MSSGPALVRSDFVFVAGDADDVAHVVIVIIFVGREEGIVVVIAFDFDIVVAHIGNVVAGGGVIGILKRDELDFGVFGIDFGNLVSSATSDIAEVSSKKDRG